MAFLTDESLQKKYQQSQEIFKALGDKNPASLSLALLPFEKQERTELTSFLDLLVEELGRILHSQMTGGEDPGIPGFAPSDYNRARQIILDTADRLRRNASITPALSLMAAKLRSI